MIAISATEFLENQASEPHEWRDAAELASHDYWLTAEELHKAVDAIRDVLEPYEQRQRAARPPNSRQVRIARLVIPRGAVPISPGERPPNPLANGEPGQRDGTGGE